MRIRIHFIRIRIRIQHLRMNWTPIRIQGFNDQKLKRNYSWNLLFIFCSSKIAIYLHTVCQSYRRSLQLSKEDIHHFKTWTFTNFFLLLWVIFALLDPDSEIRIRIHRPDWIRIRIRNPGIKREILRIHHFTIIPRDKRPRSARPPPPSVYVNSENMRKQCLSIRTLVNILANCGELQLIRTKTAQKVFNNFEENFIRPSRKS